MTKNSSASKGEEAKYNLCKPKGPVGSSHIKALSKAVLVVFVCLLVAPVNCVFFLFIYCFSLLFGKDTGGFYSKSSWFWVDSLITWAESTNKVMSSVSAVKRPSENCFTDWKSLEVDHTWPSLVSMVLIRTFLVVVLSTWGLDSIIVSTKEAHGVVLETGHVATASCRIQTYLSGLRKRSLAAGWRFW